MLTLVNWFLAVLYGLLMIYKSYLPSPSLSEFVRNYTVMHFQFNSNAPVPSKQRSPKPEQKIVFYIKGTVNRYDTVTGSLQTPPPVAIFSHQKEKRVFQLTSELSAVIIFLQPGVLHRLIKLPMGELVQEFCDAELFFGTAVREVSEQLAEARSYLAMIAIVEQFMYTQCKRLETKNAIDSMAIRLLADPTVFSLDNIAQQACLSSKQFYRRFIEQIGITPKLFSRLSRFNHAYRFKLAHPDSSWSSIAQEFRYTDYHHLEKEFKEFAGFSPQEWVKTHLTAPERILQLR